MNRQKLEQKNEPDEKQSRFFEKQLQPELVFN